MILALTKMFTLALPCRLVRLGIVAVQVVTVREIPMCADMADLLEATDSNSIAKQSESNAKHGKRKPWLTIRTSWITLHHFIFGN